MSGVSTRRLHVRAPQGWSARAQARTEEALRLGMPVDGRLILLRRLDLGSLVVDAHPLVWAQRAERRVAAVMAQALHGSAIGAGTAAAVWFRSEAEAYAILMAELAAGRRPFAWFWKLAVPGWGGEGLAAFLVHALQAAARDPELIVALARAALPWTGRALVGEIDHQLGQTPASVATRDALPASAQESPSRTVAQGGAIPTVDDEAERSAGASARAWWRRLPVHLRRVLVDVVASSQPRPSAAIQFVIGIGLLCTAPELAVAPARRIVIARAVEEMVRRDVLGPSDASIPHATPVAPPIGSDAGMEMRSDLQTRSIPAEPSSKAATRPDMPFAHAPAPLPMPPRPLEPSSQGLFERPSAAAGLWLLVRPLSRLGIAAWLEMRPGLAEAGFARALLRHIARRQRVAEDDPLFGLLGDEGAPTVDAGALDAWRIGLDRWLRRRVRRRLSEVVARRGWLVAHETGVRVRFRLDEADLALRLPALDVDPGWVPWLGMSVTYHYRDEAVR